MTDKNGTLTVFYDGGCPLCTAEISVYRKSAGAEQLMFVDVSGHDPGTVARGLDRAQALKRFHVRLANGRLVSGAAGFGHLWLALPAWRWLGRLVLVPGVLHISEAVYNGFLVFRPAMQRVWRAMAATRVRR